MKKVLTICGAFFFFYGLTSNVLALNDTLFKRKIPNNVKIDALGGKKVRITEEAKKLCDRIECAFEVDNDTFFDPSELSELNRRQLATTVALFPYYKDPAALLADFLPTFAKSINKNEVSRILFDPFYLKLFNPVKNFYLPWIIKHQCANKGEVIAIGGPQKKLVFGIQQPNKADPNLKDIVFLDSNGNLIMKEKAEEDWEFYANDQFKPTIENYSHGIARIGPNGRYAFILRNNVSGKKTYSKLKNSAFIINLKKKTKKKTIDLTQKKESHLFDINDIVFGFSGKRIAAPGPDSLNIYSVNDETINITNNAILEKYISKAKVRIPANFSEPIESTPTDDLEKKRETPITRLVFSNNGKKLALCTRPEKQKGTISSRYLNFFQILQHRIDGNHKAYWKDIYECFAPHISDICFAPDNNSCVLTSATDGATYVSLLKDNYPKPIRLQAKSTNKSSIGASRVIFSDQDTVFALILQNKTVQIYDYGINPKEPLLIAEFSQKQNMTYCGNEQVLDAKFSPYEKNMLVMATQGDIIASWNYLTNHTENFLAYIGGKQPNSTIRELFVLNGPRHVLIWYQDGSIREVYGLDPRTFFVKKLLSKSEPFTIANLKRPPSLFKNLYNENSENSENPLVHVTYNRKKIVSHFEIFF